MIVKIYRGDPVIHTFPNGDCIVRKPSGTLSKISPREDNAYIVVDISGDNIDAVEMRKRIANDITSMYKDNPAMISMKLHEFNIEIKYDYKKKS